MFKNKKLLVLITAYNHEAYIKKCLDSVLEQKTKYQIKIICFDDCSTDGTFGILNNFQKQFPENIQVIKNKKNLGWGKFSIMKNANKYSQDYDYWTILNGDDSWSNKDKVEKQIDTLENNSNYIGCCGYTEIYDEYENYLRTIKQDVSSYKLKDLIVYENYRNLYAHPSSIIWRNVYYAKYNFILPINKYSKIKGDVSIMYLMLNFDDEKRIFCLDEIVSRYNFNKKGVWSSLSEKKREKLNKYNFLNLMRMVSLKYKILILLKKLNIINAKKN